MGSILDRDEKLIREMRSGKGKLSPDAQLNADAWAAKEPHITSDALRQGLGWVKDNAPDVLAEPLRRASKRDAEGHSGLRFADDMLREITPGSPWEIPLMAVGGGKGAKVLGTLAAGALGADEAVAGGASKLAKVMRGGEKLAAKAGKTFRDLVPDAAEDKQMADYVASKMPQTPLPGGGAGNDKLALVPQQAPMISTSKGTGLDLLPRDKGMYDPSVVQRALPRQQGRGGEFTPRMQALLDDPRVTKHIDELIARGFEINPDLQHWYGTYPLKQVFGDVRGSMDRWPDFRAHLSGASQRNPVPKQNQMGSLLWSMDEQGLLADPNIRLLTNKLREAEGPNPANAIALPEGYGSLAQGAIFDRSKRIAQGAKPEDVLDRKVKLGSFDENLEGNLTPTTIDVNAMKGPIIMSRNPDWLTSKLVDKDETGKVIGTHTPRADYASGKLSMDEAVKRPGFWESAPEGSEYQGFENLWTRGAERAGVHPAEGQGLGWYGSVGISGLKSPPETYIAGFERQVKDRAQKLGMKPLDLLAQIMRGQNHLAVPAATGLGAAAIAAGQGGEEEPSL